MKTTPYHHGDLPKALLEAGETILRRDGIAALTLRAVAREAGVSHAAPAPHFKDLTGLLSELAAVGHHRLADDIQAGLDPANTKYAGPARAYIGFAKENPELFRLMSSNHRLDGQRPSLRDARLRSMQALALSRNTTIENPDAEAVARMAASWSLVHGFASLMIDGRFGSLLRAAPPGTTEADLLDAVLDSSRRANWP
jgi:AcrR family transcriptional regulator